MQNNIKQLLREQIEMMPKKVIVDVKQVTKKVLKEMISGKRDLDLKKVNDFIIFVKNYLNIGAGVKIELTFERTPDLTTTAYYNYKDKRLKVYVKNRLYCDFEKSIAHEMVHHLQNIEQRLTNPEEDGKDGSPLENEANSKAGEIIRKWGKLHPEIYYTSL